MESISGKLQDPIKSSAVPKELKLAVTLRILAEGSYQKGAGNDYNVGLSQSSVSKIFTECIDAMHSEICPKWISVRMTEVEKFEIKDYFYKKFKFPGIIGCIDGTHIKILAPGVGERFKYYNRKGFYSLNATVVNQNPILNKSRSLFQRFHYRFATINLESDIYPPIIPAQFTIHWCGIQAT